MNKVELGERTDNLKIEKKIKNLGTTEIKVISTR